MGLNKEKISRIIGESKRFCSPFSDPEPYYIIDSDTDRPDRNSIDLFYRKLTYAVRNADILIGGAFDDGFYNFYGINRDIVRSPSEIADQLYFDSFVLNIKDNSIGACLSNSEFMFGHFIEVRWDNDWKLIGTWID